MAQKVLLTLVKTFEEACPEVRDELQRRGFEVVSRSAYEPLSEEELIGAVRDVDAHIVGLEKVTRRVIEAARNLKCIAVYGAGVDNVDIEAATERRIPVVNAPGANAVSVAEMVIGLMIALARHMIYSDKRTRAGEWKLFVGVELNGKTIGIVGTGAIGCEVAKRAKAFGMEILCYDTHEREEIKEEYEAKYVPLETLLKESDFVTLHVPLSKETRGMIGKRQLEMMKPTAYLVNTARGGVVDEDSLYDALKNKVIAGAALDVYSFEPPAGSPLLGLDNVIMTSHIGGATIEAIRRIAEKTIDNVTKALNGEKPSHVVNPGIYQ